MSRFVKIASLLALAVVVVFLAAGVVYAQSETPEPPYGERGRWGGRWGDAPGPGRGILAEYRDLIHERLAAELGISVEELEAAIAEGKSLFTLADENEVDLADLKEAMTEARAEALEQAVADGVITQEQADWMLERHARMRPGHGGCGEHGRREAGILGVGPRGRLGARSAFADL